MSDVTSGEETPDEEAESVPGPPTTPAGTADTVEATAAAVAIQGTRPVNRRKVREGLVSSSVQDKTVVVNVIERVRHPRYAKTVQRTKHFYAHDEQNEVRVGDRVRIQETRPISKLKRWRVVEVLERAR